MTLRRYRVLGILAICWLAACGSAPTPAPPFARYTAQDVLSALTAAGLSAANPRRDVEVGRGAPLTFNDRYTFEIDIRDVAPAGGQILVFDTADAMKRWQDYIITQKANSATRRDWLFVFARDNIMLQVNAGLTNDEADRYHQALDKMP